MKILHTTPAQDGFYMPAEFAPHEGCLMIWPERADSWQYGAYAARKAFLRVIETISESESMTVLCSEGQYDNARAQLPDRVRLVVMETDDAWARDVGPTFVINGRGERRGIDWGFNAWGGDVDGLYPSWEKDNRVARKFCDLVSNDVYDKRDFICEGGSIHSDGEGTALVTEACLLSAGRNPDLTKAEIEQVLCDYLGVSKVIWLPRGIYNDETNEHVDNVCAFTAPGEVVLAWTDDESDVKVIAPEEEKEESSSHPLAEMLIGAALFVAGLLIPAMAVKLVLLIAAYLLLGRHVLLTAVKNIGRGQVFDENFLMAVATIGAWAVGSFDEAVGVMLFYRVGEYFEDRAVDRSRKQIMDAIDLRPETVNLVKDNGKIEVIPAEDAQEGDIVLVRPGDRVPLDGEVIEGESRLDTSAVTGEPVPVRVAAGDKATSGCVNTDGAIKLRVTHILAESMVQRILDSVENAAARKPKIDRFITRFSRVYTPAVVAIALLTAIIPSLVTGEWHKWVYTAMTFLVISCPCALVLSVPLTYFSGIGAGSRRGILFKGGASLEALNNVKTIVMDKTGTITKGNFVVQKVVPAQGVPLDENELLWLAAACEGASTHPIAKSIINSYEERKTSAAKAGDFSLVAVGATVENIREQAGEGVFAELEGKTILCGNVKLMERNNIDLSGYHGTPGSTEVLLAMDGHFLGHIDISDTIKADANSAISRMKAQGLTTAMLTGDGQASADAVAQEVGIDEVRARLLPQDKLSALTDIREKCGAVMFVGDGINDAPVLAGADVGAAMGSGADAAIEAADVVFMKADLTSIPISVKIARKANIVSKENIVFALAVKILVMILGLFGIASMWLAVFADTGVAMLCVLNSIRMLYMKTE